MVSLTVTSGDSPHRACFKQRNCQHSHNDNQENKLNLSTNDKGPGLSSQGDLHDICWSKNYNHDLKGTKLKRLKLGQLGEGEENLDERLVKEAREAIGYLQLDLPAQNRESDSDSEVSVEDGNVAEETWLSFRIWH